MAIPFQNWSRTVTSQPRSWSAPSTEAEVVAAVRHARGRGGHVRVHGAKHSWSAIAAPTDVAMTLRGLDRVVSVDRDALTVTVQAGIPLQALVDVLATHGLALPILGSIAEQSIAGAAATGTHGSSRTIGNLGSGIVGARVVTGTGDIRDIGPDDDALHGLRVSLGALGILTQVTLRVVPLFKLVETRRAMPFDEACIHILDIADSHDFAKLWWLPHTERPVVFTYDRTEAAGEPSVLSRRVDGFLNDVVLNGALRLGGLVPSFIPTILRSVARTYMADSTRVGRYDRVLTLVMPPRHRETELAFHADQAPEALHFLHDWVARTRSRLDFIQELRFVAQDASWMSPAYGRPTCQFGVYGTFSPELDAAMEAFRAWGRDHDARPHWGKEHTLDEDTVDALYPEAPRFRALAQAWDPDGVFRNRFLDAVLGPLDPH